MKDSEGKNHPHLLMLDEFEGRIEGELKYNKVLYKYRWNTSNQEEWSFTREQWGPTDPGFTSIMASLDDLDLADTEDIGTHIFQITDKGRRVAGGLKRGLDKLDPGFSGRVGVIQNIADRDMHRSGTEIVEDEEIQSAKEETEQSRV